MYIHTFKVSAILNNENYYKIQEILRKDKEEWKSKEKGMFYFGLYKKGILIRFKLINKKGFNSYQIMYRISARRVIDNDDYVGLFNTNDYDELAEKVDKVLENKCSLLPKLNDCTLSRLDFCFNAVLENQSQVKAYIKTARRANIPKDMKRYEIYDKKARRTKPTKNDMTVLSHKSDHNVEVSIYNKYEQMKKVKECSKEEMERAKNIVRIEIRCKEEKIKELKKKYEIRKTESFMARADIIGGELFRYYLSGMFNHTTIRTLHDSLARISQSDFKPKDKENLCDFIMDINASRSAAVTIRNFKEWDKDATNKILYMLSEIDVNYVTATKEDIKEFRGGYIPTPLELFNEFVRSKQ